MREKATGKLLSWWEDPDGYLEDGGVVACPDGCEVVDLGGTTLKAFEAAASQAAGAEDVSGVGDMYLHDTAAASKEAPGRTASPPELSGAHISVTPAGEPLPTPEERAANRVLSVLKDAFAETKESHLTPAVVDVARSKLNGGST